MIAIEVLFELERRLAENGGDFVHARSCRQEIGCDRCARRAGAAGRLGRTYGDWGGDLAAPPPQLELSSFAARPGSLRV